MSLGKRSLLVSASLFFTAAFVTGCSNMVSTASPNQALEPGAIAGFVHGGRQPVSSATLTLWAAGNAGYGSAATPLATTISGSDGSFGFAGSYTCPSTTSTTASQQLYITATGGQPSPGVTNSVAALMVALGDCVSVKSSNPNLNIDEVTTVASIFALQQFFSPSSNGLGNIGTSTGNITGLRNAIAAVPNLVTLSTGIANAATTKSQTVSGYTTSPVVTITPETAKIDTISDILASCINSSGSTSTQCSTLFADVNVTPAKDTLQAAYYMASNPTSTVNGTSHIGDLFGLSPAAAPFTPSLSQQPTDWTIGVTYGSTASQTVGASSTYLISNPKFIAMDSTGNVWLVNSSTSATGGSSVTELSPTGLPEAQVLTAAGTLVAPSGLAVDPSNDLFVPSFGASGTGNTVSEYTSLGSTRTFTLLSTGPQAIASDGAGNVFVATAGTGAGLGDLEAIPANSASGTATVLQASNVSAGADSALVIDENFNLWLSNANNTAITQFLCTANPCMATSTALAPHPDSLAVDHAGDIWAGNITGTLTELAATSTTNIVQSSGSPYSGGGLSGPFTGLIDGLGNVWETDLISGTGAVSEFTNAGVPVSPSTGFMHTFNGATGLAIDASGNVWIGNSTATASATTAGYVTEIVGQAAPLVTPLAAALPATAGGVDLLGSRP